MVVKNLCADVLAFATDVATHWLSLMSGTIGVMAWIIGAALEPMPMPMRWSCVLFGTLAIVLGCFMAWRQRYKESIDAHGRSLLLRLIDEGEELHAAELAVQDGDAYGALDANANLHQWYRETLEKVREQFKGQLDHFADLGRYDSRGTEGTTELVRLLLQRMRDIVPPA